MSPASLPLVTALYAGLLGLLALALAGFVIRFRTRDKIGIGDGGNPDMIRAIRVQGNFSEYVPLALLLMALCEIIGQAAWLTHAEGLALLAGRLLHAWGLARTTRPNFGRFVGTIFTFIVIAVAAVSLIVRALRSGAV